MKQINIHDYDDIINMDHPISKKHKQMSQLDRAAQFSPFAALTGHKEAVIEAGRLTSEKITLDEHKMTMLDEALQKVLQNIKEHPLVTITYFTSDSKKQGGCYQTLSEPIKKIDDYNRTLVFVNGTTIKIDDIVEIVL